MTSQSDKTEQPTQRRQKKAREQGQFASSRPFVSAVQFMVFLLVFAAGASDWLEQLKMLMARLLSKAALQSLESRHFVNLVQYCALTTGLPVLKAGAVVAAGSIATQLVSTRMGFSCHRLVPNWSRLNPVKNLRGLLSQNLPQLWSSFVITILFGLTIYWVVTTELPKLLLLSMTNLSAACAAAVELLQQLLWRAGLLILAVGTYDLVRQILRHRKELKMSRQELMDELKETEGNPLVRVRMRRLQRETRRAKMLRDVAQATAVIVNPTHYAVALKYSFGEMGAPLVVGKGRGHLAMLMRETASRHQVTIVENPPLARALYRSVEVGQEIPPALYRAVAEILAYVYRILRP